MKNTPTTTADLQKISIQTNIPLATLQKEYKIYELGRETQITKRESASSGTLCLAHMTPQLLTRWQEYLVVEKMALESAR